MGDAGDDFDARARAVRGPALTRIVRALRLLWAMLPSILGVMLSPLFRSRRRVHGILLCEGADWPRRLRWGYRAVTLGHVVLSVDSLDEETLAHELVHVRQYEALGPFMIPAYAAAALLCLLRGRHPYRDNPFEVAARSGSRKLRKMPMSSP